MMEIFLISLVVSQSVATCLFFARRWDQERSKRIEERCEWEARELELRKQLAEVLNAQAAQVNAAILYLKNARKQLDAEPLVASIHQPQYPQPQQELNGQNLVFFNREP